MIPGRTTSVCIDSLSVRVELHDSWLLLNLKTLSTHSTAHLSDCWLTRVLISKWPVWIGLTLPNSTDTVIMDPDPYAHLTASQDTSRVTVNPCRTPGRMGVFPVERRTQVRYATQEVAKIDSNELLSIHIRHSVELWVTGVS